MYSLKWRQLEVEFYRAAVSTQSLKSLSKPRRQQQPERHQTKGLISKTIAVHVRYKSLYISLRSSAKQQCDMTKFCVVYDSYFLVFPFGTERRRYVFSFSTFLESLAYRPDLDDRQFRW